MCRAVLIGAVSPFLCSRDHLPQHEGWSSDGLVHRLLHPSVCRHQGRRRCGLLLCVQKWSRRSGGRAWALSRSLWVKFSTTIRLQNSITLWRRRGFRQTFKGIGFDVDSQRRMFELKQCTCMYQIFFFVVVGTSASEGSNPINVSFSRIRFTLLSSFSKLKPPKSRAFFFRASHCSHLCGEVSHCLKIQFP